MQPAEPRTGSIYDLGYRNYEGARLGRRHSIVSLYLYTLRGAFGIGRRTSSKIIPIFIAILAFLPAIAQLAVAAIFTDEIDVWTPEDYFGYVEVPIALFCGAIAPEIAGRDMRQRTLALYFSRALGRRDYALAKIAAFTTALMVLTLVPQVFLILGNGFATKDLPQYVSDNWADLPRTLAAGTLIAATAGSVSLAIAAQTHRRAYATVAVVVWFLVLSVVCNILVYSVGGAADFAVYLTPFDFMHGATMWIFGSEAGPDSIQGEAGFALWTYGVCTIAYLAAGVALVIRRFDRIPA